MNPLFSLAMFVILFTSAGCEQVKQPDEDTELEHIAEKIIHDVHESDFEVIIIDDCEYLIYKEAMGSNQGYGFMSHKGNCKNPIHKQQSKDITNASP